MNKQQASTWVSVCSPDDVPLRGSRVVETQLGRLAIFRTAQGEFFALKDACPHKAGPLSQGIVHGKSVTCPLHSWVISLETGEALGADEGKTCVFQARIVDELVQIDLGESISSKTTSKLVA